MAQVQTEASSVKKGLADRMKPRTAQSTGGRQAGGSAGQTAQRRIDPSKFLNPKAGYAAYGRRGQPPATRSGPTPPAAQPTTGATRPVGQTTIHGGFRGASATAGAPPQTSGAPGGRFGAWTPRVATPAAQPGAGYSGSQQVGTGIGGMPLMGPGQYQGQQRTPMAGAPGQVPGQYQTPGRPMPQAAPMPMRQPMTPQVAQPFYPQPQMAQPMRQPMAAPQMAQPTGQPAPQTGWVQAGGQPAPQTGWTQGGMPPWMGGGGGPTPPAGGGGWIGGPTPPAGGGGWTQGGMSPWATNPDPYGRW